VRTSVARSAVSEAPVTPQLPSVNPSRWISAELHQHAQGAIDGREFSRAEDGCDLGVELGEDVGGDRCERACPLGQEDQGGAPVCGIRTPFDQPVAFEPAHERRHRLLRQPSATGQIAHSEPVLLVERDQDRPIGRPHLREPAGGEPLGELLVPALAGLGE
jgi:hypothetical protein